jgi:hypothetical protein
MNLAGMHALTLRCVGAVLSAMAVLASLPGYPVAGRQAGAWRHRRRRRGRIAAV